MKDEFAFEEFTFGSKYGDIKSRIADLHNDHTIQRKKMPLLILTVAATLIIGFFVGFSISPLFNITKIKDDSSLMTSNEQYVITLPLRISFFDHDYLLANDIVVTDASADTFLGYIVPNEDYLSEIGNIDDDLEVVIDGRFNEIISVYSVKDYQVKDRILLKTKSSFYCYISPNI